MFKDHHIPTLNTVSKYHGLFCSATAAEGMIDYTFKSKENR